LCRYTAALHTLDRPFKCEVPNCGMTYMTRLDLDRHVKKHNKWEQKVGLYKLSSVDPQLDESARFRPLNL
jgi:uncharacterized C2H2 Zn-finger protein